MNFIFYGYCYLFIIFNLTKGKAEMYDVFDRCVTVTCHCFFLQYCTLVLAGSSTTAQRAVQSEDSLNFELLLNVSESIKDEIEQSSAVSLCLCGLPH